MRDHERETQALRDLLRRGDPAADGREPGPPELARMRSSFLAAAGDGTAGRERAPWLLGLAAAAAVVAALTVGWLLYRDAPLPPTAGPDVVSPRVPVVSEPIPGEREPAEAPALRVAEIVPPPPVEPPAAVAAAAAPTARTARQVQLRGPGGTKILWKLDPEFEL